MVFLGYFGRFLGILGFKWCSGFWAVGAFEVLWDYRISEVRGLGLRLGLGFWFLGFLVYLAYLGSASFVFDRLVLDLSALWV